MFVKTDAYETKLKEFRVKTPLDLFSQVDNEYKKPQKDFCEVVVHFKNDISKKTTLQDVERLRMRYICKALQASGFCTDAGYQS